MKIRRILCDVAMSFGLAFLAGCDREYPENLKYEFTPYTSKGTDEKGKEIQAVFDTPKQGKEALESALAEYFGTPRAPMVKVDKSIQENPQLRVTDEELARGSSLYRRLCLHCHGLVGDGNGPTGLFLNPKPRDFRRGIFKFRSTSRQSGSKFDTAALTAPSREDLLRTLRTGIPGASMPAFNLLEEPALNALVSYVIHLSLRGQVEREVARFEDADVEAELKKATTKWLDDVKTTFPPPAAPASWGSSDSAVRKANLERGKKLYLTDGACVECHGKDGRASVVENPPNTNRRNDWGDLNPPRNLTFGIFRGGARPIDVYYRMRLGIAGSGMPAASEKVSDEDLWYLVDYVLSLPSEARH